MTSHDVLDLTSESELLIADRVSYDPAGIRALLSALQLKPVSGPMVDTPRGNVFDLAVYRATGDHRLATIFGSVA